jgi:sec-independent protein translocase protein TatB
MFDIGWTELLVIGVVALIVVGPKDLPGMFRTLGRFTAKARTMAREFSRAMEDAADESGVGDVAKDLKSMTSAKNLGLDTIKDAASRFEDWDPIKKKASSDKGPETAKLAKERAATAKKIREAGAEKANARLAKEAEAKEKTATSATAKKSTAKKTAPKKPTGKTAKNAAPKSAATKAEPKTATKPAAKKPAVKTPVAKKPTGKKPNPKSTAKGSAK